MARLAGKVALVTGAASGIGRATARAMAEEGAAIVATDLNETDGAALAEEIEGAGGQGLFLRHDVSQEDDWAAVMAALGARFGRLDVAVNNAGIGEPLPIRQTSLADWRRTIAVNLDGVFLGTKAAIEAMAVSGGGSIVNISSVLGIVGSPASAAYSAAKGGVRLLSKSAALECAEAGLGIRVNSVHPGYIETPMVQDAFERRADPAATRKHIEGLHPLGHLGDAADIAAAIVFLASDDSKFVTGTELVVDGGFTAR